MIDLVRALGSLTKPVSNEQAVRQLLGPKKAPKYTLDRPKVRFSPNPAPMPRQALQAPEQTIGGTIQRGIAKGLDSLGMDERRAYALSNRIMAPLNDVTPIGNVTGADEGARMAYQGITRGNLRTGALGAGIFALNVLPGGNKVTRPIRELLGDTRGAIRAWHGSPHDFDKFEWSPRTRGTGEGAQAYGDGLYFAENKEVADEYRQSLSRTKNNYKDLVNKVLPMPDLSDDARSVFQQHVARVGSDLALVDAAKRAGWASRELRTIPPHDLEAAMQNFLDSRHQGRLYEVNINAEPEDFLDWDRHLSEQSPQVRNAYGQLGVTPERVAEIFNPETVPLWKDPSGNAIYRVAPFDGVDPLQMSKDERTAKLLKAGIPGIRFLDQGSRASGQGTSNYVVFDDSLIDILNKF